MEETSKIIFIFCSYLKLFYCHCKLNSYLISKISYTVNQNHYLSINYFKLYYINKFAQYPLIRIIYIIIRTTSYYYSRLYFFIFFGTNAEFCLSLLHISNFSFSKPLYRKMFFKQILQILSLTSLIIVQHRIFYCVTFSITKKNITISNIKLYTFIIKIYP